MKPLDLVRGVAEWLAAGTAQDGARVCPRHHVEHTGKLVYGASLDLALLRRGGDERLKERIRLRARRTASMLRTDPRNGATVFFPGSLDHRNAATHLIDSGACCDVLAELLSDAPELFPAAEREAIEHAVRAVATSYLAKAALVKEVPAQRLWGATGLARASVLLRDPALADAAREACRRAVLQANADGSMPYMPEPERHGEHPGLADVSTFYHSRHVGFLSYVHRVLGEEPPPDSDRFLRRGASFLAALYGFDGIKPLVNEAKQWYWESPYEVASHSFDVHAFVESARRHGDPRSRHFASLSYARLAEHVAKDGGVVSHHGPEVNFQCRDFWNGHVAWIARVLDEVPLDAPRPEPCRTQVFEESGLVRLERAEWAAILRGRKQPINISFGGDVGGGSLVWFGRREDGWKDRVRQRKWASLAPGNFVVTPAARPSFRRRVASFYRDNRHDVRFRLYVANIERRAGNTRKAVEYPVRHVVEKLADELKGRYCSHFDVRPSLASEDGAIVFGAMLARRDGQVLEGSALTRRYLPRDDHLEVEDRLDLESPVRAALYVKPPGAMALSASPAARETREHVVFTPGSFPAALVVRYRL